MVLADGIRLNSLRLGPPSAYTVLAETQQGGRFNVAFQAPDRDADFDAAVADFITYANANLANIGLVAADMTPVTNAKTDWDTKFASHNSAQSAAQSASQAKNDSRFAMEAAIRTVVLKMEGSGQLNDAERAAMHITVRDVTPTPSPVPTTRPVGQVDTSQRLRHTVSFVDETTPGIRRKPAGVLGAEIYSKIGGPPPTDDSDVTYLATDTRSPHVILYDADEAGQIAHYMLRWINTRGERGPWSETVSATVGA